MCVCSEPCVSLSVVGREVVWGSERCPPCAQTDAAEPASDGRLSGGAASYRSDPAPAAAARPAPQPHDGQRSAAAADCPGDHGTHNPFPLSSPNQGQLPLSLLPSHE